MVATNMCVRAESLSARDLCDLTATRATSRSDLLVVGATCGLLVPQKPQVGGSELIVALLAKSSSNSIIMRLLVRRVRWLGQGHRASTPRQRFFRGTAALAVRSAFDRASVAGAHRAHIDHAARADSDHAQRSARRAHSWSPGRARRSSRSRSRAPPTRRRSPCRSSSSCGSMSRR